jgi:hypothetical protein
VQLPWPNQLNLKSNYKSGNIFKTSVALLTGPETWISYKVKECDLRHTLRRVATKNTSKCT